MKFFKFLLALLFIPVFTVLIYINYSLLKDSKCHQTINGLENTEVIYQLNHIKTKLEKGAADDMQSIYPEGFVFLYSLYGLSWADVGQTLTPNSELHQKSIQEIDVALANIHSEKGKAPFSESLVPTYGAYYLGWSNYLLSKKLQITPENQQDSIDIQRFINNCDKIVSALNQTTEPFLPSYSGLAWQADNILCLASLAVHDKIFEPKYAKAIQDWLTKIKTTVDTETELIGHEYRFDENKTLPPRGSSQSLMNSLLFEIDTAFANEQTQLYKDNFLMFRFGLPAIREYAKGTNGEGDIDSGPVIWDVGGAASIVGIRALGLAGEVNLHQGIRNSVNAFAFAQTSENSKQYLLGKLPIADAFIAWANAKNCQINQKNTYWQWRFQLISLGILGVFGLLFFVINKKIKSE